MTTQQPCNITQRPWSGIPKMLYCIVIEPLVTQNFSNSAWLCVIVKNAFVSTHHSVSTDQFSLSCLFFSRSFWNFYDDNDQWWCLMIETWNRIELLIILLRDISRSFNSATQTVVCSPVPVCDLLLLGCRMRNGTMFGVAGLCSIKVA